MNLLLQFIERCPYCGHGRWQVVAVLWPDRAGRSIRRPGATGMKRGVLHHLNKELGNARGAVYPHLRTIMESHRIQLDTNLLIGPHTPSQRSDLSGSDRPIHTNRRPSLTWLPEPEY